MVDFINKVGLLESSNNSSRIISKTRNNREARLPNGTSTLYESFIIRAKIQGSSNLLGNRRIQQDGKLTEYMWRTYAQVRESSRKVGFGLEKLGLHHREVDGRAFIGIYSENKEEWLVADLALVSQGITSVPMHVSQPTDTIHAIVEQTWMKAIFCSESLGYNLLELRRQGLVKSIKYLFTTGPASTEFKTFANEGGIKVFSLTELENLNPEGRENPPTSEDWFTYHCFEGSTDKLKFEVITHQMMAELISDCLETTLKVFPSDTHISYLPLAHFSERIMVHMCLVVGASVKFFSGDIIKLRKALKDLNPEIFLAVPIPAKKTISQVFSPKRNLMNESLNNLIKLKENHSNKTAYTIRYFDEKASFGKQMFVLGDNFQIIQTSSACTSYQSSKALREVFSAPCIESDEQSDMCDTRSLNNASEGPTETKRSETESKLKNPLKPNLLSSNLDDKHKTIPRDKVSMSAEVKPFDSFKSSNEPLQSFREICELRGYHSESHFLTTEDGYDLTLFHLKSSNPSSKLPILLVHGLDKSAASFVVKQSSKGPAFLLSDDGHDVWLLNTRGTSLSRSHRFLNPKSKEYWYFTLNDIGRYDIPASLDYICSTTNHSKVNFLGYSQGGFELLFCLAVRPSYSQKINLAALFCPAGAGRLTAQTKNAQALLDPRFVEVLEKQGIFFTGDSKNRANAETSNSAKTQIKAGISRQLVLYQQQFAVTTSTTNIRYLKQLIECKKPGPFFFDHGSQENLKRYGQEEPPRIDYSRIDAKLALFGGKYDGICSLADLKILFSLLPKESIVWAKFDYDLDHQGFMVSPYQDHMNDVLKLLNKN